MRFKRYLAVMGATSVTAAALVAGFNLLVDPLGISPIRIAIAGFNEWKPLRQDYDRIVKPYDVRRSHPRTIFIGSSRIKQTIDPKLFAGTRFAPAYNAGINGSADYEELIHIFNTTSEQIKNCVMCSSRRSHRRCFRLNRAHAW